MKVYVYQCLFELHIVEIAGEASLMYWGWHHDITLWTSVNSGKRVWEEAGT